MRTSCNGCRVLRKGCSDDCTIRPCLVWIKSPEAQANATVFLAKFYGRAGLLNLLNAGPDHLRPAIFQSLLYEACGRVVDPVYGSVGLLYSGQWHQCQMAVDAVLKGLPIMQLPNTASQPIIVSPLKLYDIRHMSSSSSPPPPTANDSPSPLVVPEFPQRIRTRARLKRRPRVVPDSDRVSNSNGDDDEDLSLGNDSLFSAETTEEGSVGEEREGRLTRGEEEMGLDLTLGFTFDDNKYGDHMRSSSSSY